MLFTPHALVGAAIGSALPSPLAAFLGGFISHHLLDMVPHFDQGSFRLVKPGVKYLGGTPESMSQEFTKRDWLMLFADWLVALLLFAFVVPYLSWSVLPSVALGMLGGLTPDLINNSPLWSRKLEQRFAWVGRYDDFHTFFHWTVETKTIWLGILTQLLVAGIALFILMRPSTLAFL